MSTLNELIVADMSGLNEGHPHGVPSYYDFYSGPVTVMGNNPEGNSAIEWWMGMYVDAGGNPATNTIVNFRNARLYWFNTQTNAWETGLDTNVFDVGYYAENYSVDYGTGPTIRHESDGSISFGTVAGKVAHGYAPWPRIPFDPAHFGGVVSVLEARLILDNGAGTDDRASAKYLVSTGGDYYPSTTGPGIENNPGIAGGKMKYVTSDWQLFAMTTLTQAQLDALPALPFTFGGASTGVGGTTGGDPGTGGTGGGSSHAYWRWYFTDTDEGNDTAAVVIAELKAYDSSGTQIATTGGTASASHSSGSAGNAFDGSSSTYWDAGTFISPSVPAWLQYQFPSAVAIDHFTITNRPDSPGYGPVYFVVQYSDDGSAWHTQWSYQGASGWDRGAGVSRTFYTTGIVWRVRVTSTQAGTGSVSVADLRFFDSGTAQISTATGTPLGSTAFSSGGDPSGAFAGSCSQMWRSGYTLAVQTPAFVGFHFPTSADVATFSFRATTSAPSSGLGEAPSTFSIQKSLDGATWTTVQSYTAATWTTNCQSQTFSLPAVVPPAPASMQVTPNFGSQCHTYTLTAAGTNTHWDGTTTVAISGTGATISGVSVTSATSLTFTLTLTCTAPLGARVITATTGSEIVTDAYTVGSTTFPSGLVQNNIALSQIRMGFNGRFGTGMYFPTTDGSVLPGEVPIMGGPDGQTLVGSGMSSSSLGSGISINGPATVQINGEDVSFDDIVLINGA